MASKQDTEERVVLEEGVAPGWMYDKASQMYFSENTNKIEVKKSPPSFKFEIMDNEFLKKLVNSSEIFKSSAWVKDYRKVKGGYTWLLKGCKVITEEGCNIEAHHKNLIVKSVDYTYYADMLMNFSCQINADVKKDFSNYLQRMVKRGNYSFIPPIINNAFLHAFLYPGGEESKKEITSIKHGLQEFCRLLRENEVSKFASIANVLKPVSNKPNMVSYSTAVKKPIPEIMKASTDVVKIGLKEKTGETLWTSKASSKTHSTEKLRGNESKPDIIIGGKSSKSEVFSPREKSQEQANISSSARNILDDAIEKTVQSITQNVEELKKVRQHSSASRCQIPHGGITENCKNPVADVHGRQSFRNPPVEMVCRSQIEFERKSYTPKEGKNTCSLKKDKIDNAYKESDLLNGTFGDPHPLCSKTTNSVTASGAGVHPKDMLAVFAPIDHEKNIVSRSSKVPQTCESFPKNTSECKIVEDASSLLKDRILKDERLPAVYNVESEVEKYGDTNRRHVPMGQHMQMSESYQTHGDQRELEAENHMEVAQECEELNKSSAYLKPFKEINDKCGMKRKYFGVCSNMEEKTIILVGASGSGKTTLINFVANYFKGFKSADDHLVRVEVNDNDARSHTTSITAYTFCFTLGDTPITVVDTPGLNDSSGAEVRDHVLSLKTFLANALSRNFKIHAIGFVAQAHLVRLTSSERLVMDYVSSLFGQDISEHFITFITFADNQETPPVVEAIKSYGVCCKTFLKFNNSALSNSKTDEVDDLDRVYWRIGSKSWKKCLNYLKTVSALSVRMMQAVESEVYVKNVIECAERDLKAELKTFINFCKQFGYNTKETNQKCEQVWSLAAAVHHLTSVQQSSAINVEIVLVKISETVCEENGYNSSTCMKYLSLAPTRNLVNAGIGLIQSIAPVYKSAKEVSMKRRKINHKDTPKVLFCHECHEYHELERVKPSVLKNLLSFVRQNSSLVSYKCKKCKCDGNLHGLEEDNSQESLYSCNLHPEKLLQHTRNCISAILESMSISGYRLDEDYYLKHINYITGQKFEMLIKDLLEMK